MIEHPSNPETYVKTIFTILLTLILSLPTYAEEAEVLMVKATHSNGLWNFDVTVHHPDVSIEHMMNSIAVFLPTEEQLAIAEIPKPSIGSEHVTTQLNEIAIPEDVEYIIIRGHCNSDGWTPEGIVISLM